MYLIFSLKPLGPTMSESQGECHGSLLSIRGCRARDHIDAPSVMRSRWRLTLNPSCARTVAILYQLASRDYNWRLGNMKDYPASNIR